MLIGLPKESDPLETRVALIPESVKRLTQKGFGVIVEHNLGLHLEFSDADYVTAGASVADHSKVISTSDILLRLKKPPVSEIHKFKTGCIHISFLDPFNEPELIDCFVKNQINAISMEMIPRTTLAQKMDALSSQANLAGYVMVILAAERLDRILPMMMTPAGTITPARVFVIGAGVAGLQAIATAKRLGARVEAFDTRPVVEEQVQSLGAKFVKVDLGETGQTKDGYAKQLTQEQLAKQREAMAKVCINSDIVITTAQLFGRKAPMIINKEIIAQMKPGSIVVDMAVESGGNVEGSVPGEEIEINGVKILGLRNLPGRVAKHASQMYSSNLTSLLETFWDVEKRTFDLDLNNDILKGCLITYKGELINETIRKFRSTNSS